MSPELWTGIGQVAVFVGVGAISSYSAFKARRAERQTRGTGNGWAQRVDDKLDRIEGKIDGHIQAHADADLRKWSNGRP